MQLNVDDFAPASDSEKESLSVMRESVSFWKDGLRRLRKNPIAMVSLAVLIIVLILAFIVPAFYPYDYATQIRGSENLGPMQYSEAEQAAMAAGEVKALGGVSIHLKEGEVLGIVGESGSGKSVTAYSLMGLTAYPGRLIGGTLDFNGHHINDMSEKEMRRIRGNEVSIIFQDPMTSLNPVYTIGNQIREVILLHTGKSKKEANERAKELLTLVGINEPEKRLKQYPHELSGGMRQRVMIAIALACEPKLLIADEPTTALDVTIQAQILELMMDLKEKLGMAIIMITHDLGIVARMCEKIAVMYAGKIVEYGTTDEIFYEPKHEYTKGLLRSIPRLDSRDHERLVPIEGTPVDMLNPPKGCPFAPRCGACMKVCLREMPPRTDFSDTHYTQCWLCQKAEFEAAQGGNVQ